MWKLNIILRQTKDDGTGSRTSGPAAGSVIRKDFGPTIDTVSSTKLLNAAANRVFKDTGISLPDKSAGIEGRQYNNGLAKPNDASDKTKKKFSETFFGQSLSSVNQALSSETAQGIYHGIGTAASLAGSFIDQNSYKNPTGYNNQQAIGSVLMKSNNPYLMAAGAAYNTLSTIAEATGGNTNTITKDQADEVGINKWERFGNNVLSAIPGLGWGRDKTMKGQKSHLIDEMGNAYADTVSDINLAGTLGDSKFLFGQNKIQDHIITANRNNQLLTEMNMTNTQRKKSDYAQDIAQQNLNRYMGTNYMDMRMGKQGMKFPELDDIREMLKNRVLPEDTIQKFADGGSILPTGKLHKERHHIESISPDLEDVITKKGIPVVTMDEGGSLVAVAEIERDEWTLSKEFTDQIEALWKDGSEEAMIECGKLVCEELLKNTQDSSNILGKEEENE